MRARALALVAAIGTLSCGGEAPVRAVEPDASGGAPVSRGTRREATPPQGYSVNVHDFGALGDGMSDDTDAFAAAISASRNIWVPCGTYLVDALSFVTRGTDDPGYTFRGASTTCTRIKARTSRTRTLLEVRGDGAYTQGHTFANFTVDATNMLDAPDRFAIYVAFGWGSSFRNVNVVGTGASSRSLRVETGAYTTVFDNCDFGSTTGVVELRGTSLSDAVTTLTFVGCSFGQLLARNAVSITLIQPIIQGALDKIVLSSVAGFTVSGGDIEGTGTYLSLDGNVHHLWSIGNQFTGFSGRYRRGAFNGGALMDVTGEAGFELVPAIGHGMTVAAPFFANGSEDGLVRHRFANVNPGPRRRVDLELSTSGDGAEAVFLGVDQGQPVDRAYLDQRSGGRFAFQVSGTPIFGYDLGGLSLEAPLMPATPAGGTQRNAIYQGPGAPSNRDGRNGDFFFRTDAAAVPGSRLYVKTAGGWAGIL